MPAKKKAESEDINEQPQPERFHKVRDKIEGVKQALGLGTDWDAREEAYARLGLLGNSPDPEVEDAKE